ncbi:MAG: 2'-5' RNA ligase family protein [Bacteroidota bacterium]
MESLYFVAVVPPPDIREEITAFKQYCAEHFGSKHALRSPPHITLHMPFKWKDKRLQQLKTTLNRSVFERSLFDISLQDFDFFEPRVVFVDVVTNLSLLRLQKRVVQEMKSLHIFNANHKDRPFHPHMTVAFRDLKKSVFPEAKRHFLQSEYKASFQVDHIVLLRHEQHRWQEFDRFDLASPPN